LPIGHSINEDYSTNFLIDACKAQSGMNQEKGWRRKRTEAGNLVTGAGGVVILEAKAFIFIFLDFIFVF
jgi:hypothetical protein